MELLRQRLRLLAFKSKAGTGFTDSGTGLDNAEELW